MKVHRFLRIQQRLCIKLVHLNHRTFHLKAVTIVTMFHNPLLHRHRIRQISNESLSKRNAKLSSIDLKCFTFRQSPFSRSRPPSSTPSISISQKRLRPTDPVSQLLDIVHKIVYISLVKRSIRFHFHFHH